MRDNYTYRQGAFLNVFIQVSEPRPPFRQGELSYHISPTEQLSREHAILMRLLIAIENVLAKASVNVGTSLIPVNKAAHMLQKVVVDHHMAFEESYLYPKVKATDRLAELANVLQEQHDEARSAIQKIIGMTEEGRVSDAVQMGELVSICKEADYLFKVHIAWEESVLFTALYDIMDSDYFADIQDKLLGEERKMFGSKGLNALYNELAGVEIDAGTDRPGMFMLRRV